MEPLQVMKTRAAAEQRPVYEYDLPEEIVALGDTYVKKSVGLRKLKMSEEIAAADKAGGNQTKLAYTWARYALVEIDGRELNKSEGEDETVLEHTDPTIRDLIIQAYADMSSAKAGDSKKFLASRKIKV